MPNKDEFKECDTCWINARHPAMMCGGCYHNKEVIRRLKARIASMMGHMEKKHAK